MLPFFRQIRKRFLTDKKFSKYLLYAIGEILLVVIGILIALQVDTWRDEQKSKNYEQSILKEIRNSLLQGIPDSEAIQDRAHSTRQGAIRITEYLNGSSLSEDSLHLLIERLRFRRIYNYNSGPYESLKSAGIERISNDSLRFELIALYDDLFPAADQLINEVLRERITDSEVRFRELFPPTGLYLNARGNLEYRISLEEVTLQSPKFRQFVLEASKNGQLMEQMMTELIGRMERVSALIEAELRNQ